MNDYPIVKSFVYKGQYFFYTPYSNNILTITQKQFKELRVLEKIGFKEYMLKNCGELSSCALDQLIESGFITKPFIKEVKHKANDKYASIINRSIQRLVLQVTQRCNFSCRYCHNMHNRSARFTSEKSDMSWDVARQSVDYLINHSQDSKFVDIYFYGGEPLLNFELIKRVVEYAEDRINTKKVTYHITTNASLLTEEIILFLAKYKFKVAISLDGTEERQNWARKFANGTPTYHVVWNNVQRLITLYDNCEDVLFLPVVFMDEDKNTVVDFFKLHNIDQSRVLFLEANTSGVDYMHGVLYAETDSEGVVNTNKLNNAAISESEFNDFLKIYSNKHNIGESWHHAGTCIPGYFKLFVNAKGYFYPCENTPECEDTCIGNVVDGIDVNRATALLNIGTLTKNDCINCWAVRFCSMCAVYCIDEEKCCVNKEIKKLNCIAYKKHLLNVFKKYIDLKSEY